MAHEIARKIKAAIFVYLDSPALQEGLAVEPLLVHVLHLLLVRVERGRREVFAQGAGGVLNHVAMHHAAEELYRRGTAILTPAVVIASSALHPPVAEVGSHPLLALGVGELGADVDVPGPRQEVEVLALFLARLSRAVLIFKEKELVRRHPVVYEKK